MAIYVAPGQSFEATAEWGVSGLVGTLGVTVYDNVGGVSIPRTVANIIELAFGAYAISGLVAPTTVGQFSVVWDDGVHSAAEDLTVTGSGSIPVTPGPPSQTGTPVGLDYGDQQQAVLERRFPPSSPVGQWLQAAYTDVWNSAKWTFQRVSREQWYTSVDGTSSGQAAATPGMPAAFATATALYDDQGGELAWVEPHRFEHRHAGDTTSGRPCEFTVVDRRVRLWPAPASALRFELSYRRRLCTRNATGVIHAGFYTADTDFPLWDDHHYILVIRAKIIGLRDRSDPTAGDLEGEYARLLEAMRADYTETLPLGYQLPAYR